MYRVGRWNLRCITFCMEEETALGLPLLLLAVLVQLLLLLLLFDGSQRPSI